MVTKEQKQKCLEDSLEHISKVKFYLYQVIEDLKKRAEEHDKTKLVDPELSGLAEAHHKLENLTYGSKEYSDCLKDLGQFLNHHYANNSHHPQHYENGIEGMNLLDIIEMFCDWKAATERHKDGDLNKSFEINEKRFNINSSLIKIFKNTKKYFNW